jgi:hypothetical protein
VIASQARPRSFPHRRLMKLCQSSSTKSGNTRAPANSVITVAQFPAFSSRQPLIARGSRIHPIN